MSIPGALLLAGGQSRRFGSDKRQARLSSGQLVIEASAHQMLSSFEAVCVVLRESDRALAERLTALSPRLTVTHAPDAHLGMGHSLAHGIKQAMDWSGAAICLADMPFYRDETLPALIQTFERHAGQTPIIVPTQAGRSGHPVIFHRHYFDALSGLIGDQGARRVIEAHPAQVIKIEIDDPGIHQDIDRPEDLGSPPGP